MAVDCHILQNIEVTCRTLPNAPLMPMIMPIYAQLHAAFAVHKYTVAVPKVDTLGTTQTTRLDQ